MILKIETITVSGTRTLTDTYMFPTFNTVSRYTASIAAVNPKLLKGNPWKPMDLSFKTLNLVNQKQNIPGVVNFS